MSISVCMAVYNGEKVIGKQLNSIIIQLRDDDEIIIVDDCSKDATLFQIQQYKDPRIKIYKNSCNLGYIKSFERAIGYAEKDIIFLSDQDDEWFTDKVKKVKDAFFHQNADVVIHNAKVINENREVLKERLFTKGLGSNLISRNFLDNNHNIGCLMAVKRSILHNLIPFPNSIESHDLWLGLHADVLRKKIYFLDEILMYWIRWNNSLTVHVRNERRLYHAILTRIYYIHHIIIIYWRNFIKPQI